MFFVIIGKLTHVKIVINVQNVKFKRSLGYLETYIIHAVISKTVNITLIYHQNVTGHDFLHFMNFRNVLQ